ncbi:MAG TPA: metallopeptidase TldD-related protein [Terriglobales bacterium]
MNSAKGLGAAVVVLLAASAVCGQEQADAVFKAMRDELDRTTRQLQLQTMQKPYFIAYRIDDFSNTSVSATLGSITESNPMNSRIIGVEVRVGDYALDNSNYLSMATFSGGFGGMFSGVAQGALDDNYQEIRRQLWLATDAQYKRAVEDLSAKKAVLQNRKRSEDLPDFSKEQPARLSEARTELKTEVGSLEQLARQVSLPFRDMPDVLASSVQLQVRNIYTRYINSEGSTFTRSQPMLKLEIQAETQASDGLPVHDSVSFYGRSLDDFPAKDKLLDEARQMGRRLQQLRQAASIERYNGPVLFEDQAAAEIFAQAFAPGLVAARRPTTEDPRFEMFFDQMLAQFGGGSNLLDRIGGRVLPDFVDLLDDPRLQNYQGAKLAGSYNIDDDAVPSRENRLVEKGILKTLLVSRVPVRSILHSTGSRRGPGAVPSNLILQAAKASSNEELRQELLRRAKARGLDYGIVVRRVGGGGLNGLMRAAAMMASSPQGAPPNALLEAYKVFPDGRQEPLRGMELNEMTAASFRDILAAGDKSFVYNAQFMPKFNSIFSMGMAGTFDLPVVSFVVPSLLFEEVTMTRANGPFPAPPKSKAPLFE